MNSKSTEDRPERNRLSGSEPTAPRVFLETVPLLTRPSGLANYVAGLLCGFSAGSQPCEILSGLASRHRRRAETLRAACRELLPGMEVVHVPIPNRMAMAVPGIARFLSKPRCPPVDVAHATANSFASWLPSDATARVLTIHDVVYLRHAGTGMCSPDLEARMGHVLPGHCREADLIVTDSQFSKDEICDLLPVSPERVAVVYLASSLPDAEAPEGTAAIEHEAPFFLFVGTLTPRKNIPMLLDAFGAFRQDQPDARLVMVGGLGWRGQEQAARIGATPAVTWYRQLSDVELQSLYRSARALIMVSRYEGFGLPVLEAMQNGCPVCYGTGSSMEEVAGDAGIAVDPNDRDEIVAAMTTLWESDTTREACTKAGALQAKRFSWTTAAEQTLAAYHTALETVK